MKKTRRMFYTLVGWLVVKVGKRRVAAKLSRASSTGRTTLGLSLLAAGLGTIGGVFAIRRARRVEDPALAGR